MYFPQRKYMPNSRWASRARLVAARADRTWRRDPSVLPAARSRSHAKSGTALRPAWHGPETAERLLMFQR